jgi:hypothetical protein
MLTHTRAAVAPRCALPSLPLQPPEPWAALLDSLGAIEDEENIIVLGGDGPDLMCALLRAGAPQVTHLRMHERLEAGSASLVIVPHVPSLDWLEVALSPVRRALIANGRLDRVLYKAGRLDQTLPFGELRRCAVDANPDFRADLGWQRVNHRGDFRPRRGFLGGWNSIFEIENHSVGGRGERFAHLALFGSRYEEIRDRHHIPPRRTTAGANSATRD